MFKAKFLTLTSLFRSDDPVRFTYWNSLRCVGAVVRSGVEPEKLGLEASDGSNFFTISMRSESLPYVLIILIFSGDVGARIELLEEFLHLGRIRSALETLAMILLTVVSG